MKNLFYLTIILFVIVASIYAQNMGSEYINLKDEYAPDSQMPAVVFPHWFHQAFIDCQICHTDTGALKDFLRGKAFDVRYPAEFHSAFCGYCHDIVSGSGQNTCIKCHKPGE